MASALREREYVMRKLVSTALLFLLFTPGLGQSVRTQKAGAVEAEDLELKRLSLLADLQFLASDSLNLQSPLARASAQAETADAAWSVDRVWAKKLLREAFELTLPPEAEQKKLRARPAGMAPVFASGENRARAIVRSRILAVARRDKAFGEELIRLGSEKLGKHEEQLSYAESAEQAAGSGDIEAAGDYILKALKIDASQTSTRNAFKELAKRDRAAADRLILEYFALLRSFPVAYDDQSDIRTMFMLSHLVFPNVWEGPDFTPPGPQVMRAYVSYVMDAVAAEDPARIHASRLWLLSAWGPLRRYAPELTDAFLALEARTRAATGEKTPLPAKSIEAEYRKRYEEKVKEALESDRADEQAINASIGKGDFDKARKLIDKLPDGPQKDQFVETVNTQEALGLAAKGDVAGAAALAGRLKKAASILRVYPVIIEKCIARKDQPCASNLVSEAVRQLRQADVTPAAPPPGMPASVIASRKEADPVLMSLGKLAKLILPINEGLAMEVLNELVAAANRSEVDTGQGRTGFETDVFKAFAAKNETQSLLAAQGLEDRLRRIVSLAAVYKWRAEGLARKEQATQ